MKFLLKTLILTVLCVAAMAGDGGLRKLGGTEPEPEGVGKNCQEKCDGWLLSLIFDGPPGECQSWCATCTNPGQGPGNNANCICKLFEAIYPDLKHGECIKTLVDVLNELSISVLDPE